MRFSDPRLRDLDGGIDALTAQLETLASGLDDDSANWRPDAKRWSIAQCIDHLNAVCRLYFPDLDAAVASARAKGLVGPSEPRAGWLGGWMIRTAEPPVGMKLRSPRPFVPADKLSIEHTLEQYRADKQRLRGILAAADGLDLRRAKMRMSAFKLVKLGLGDLLAFLLAHERRHLRQAEQVRREPGFPGPQPGAVAAE